MLKFLIKLILLLLFFFKSSSIHSSNLIVGRVWPSDEYTRITFEGDCEPKVQYSILKNKKQFVLDIYGWNDNNNQTQILINQIHSIHPSIIQSVQIEKQNQKDIIRLNFEFKKGCIPQVFILRPISQYQYRLVLDLYPMVQMPTHVETHLLNNGKLKIVLDPGHGGEDPGAIGKNGLQEKEVTLKIAQHLKSLIDEQSDMKAFLTRDGDYFVPLHVRVQKARSIKADLFLSIHADAWIKPTASGSSAFVLSQKGATSAQARWLANKENSSDLIGGINLSDLNHEIARVLIDLSTTAQINNSIRAASVFLSEIKKVNTLHTGSVEQAGFAVLKAPDIPSVLIETAFISNPNEELLLNSTIHQEKLATAIMNGIRRYFSVYPILSKND